MVYFRLVVRRPNSIKIHNNTDYTVTKRTCIIQNKVFTKFHVRAVDTIAGCSHSIVLLIVLESKINTGMF